MHKNQASSPDNKQINAEQKNNTSLSLPLSLSLWLNFSPSSIFPLPDDAFLLTTTQSTDPTTASAPENPIPGPHQTSCITMQFPRLPSPLRSPSPLLLLLLLLLSLESFKLSFFLFWWPFFFLTLFPSQPADDLITAGTDTCCAAPAVHPRPLKVAPFFFVWSGGVAVKWEWKREEIIVLDLEVLEICGFGSVSVAMGCSSLCFLSLIWSAIVVLLLSAKTGISLCFVNERERMNVINGMFKSIKFGGEGMNVINGMFKAIGVLFEVDFMV